MTKAVPEDDEVLFPSETNSSRENSLLQNAKKGRKDRGKSVVVDIDGLSD